MGMRLLDRVRNFFGVFALTPFEQDLLVRLKVELDSEDSGILEAQLKNYNVVRRLTKHVDVPGAHGFTNFHCQRFGKDISNEVQHRKFSREDAECVLANAVVTFDNVRIDVQFWIVRGVFFRIEYRSPQKIYCPIGKYVVQDWQIWPGGSSD